MVGVDGKLIAIEMVNSPPEAPWPSNIFSLFSLGWRQEKELGRKDPYPELKQGWKILDMGSIQENIISLQSSFSSTGPRAHPSRSPSHEPIFSLRSPYSASY